ncbi:MAG: TonB-dependent receptor [Acidobacteria bacterium]|nr:TonB-dependent receptor [Acidobacteriota bacterium]
MKTKLVVHATVLVLLALLITRSALAQRAAINGRVIDPSGAVVVGAGITVTSTATGIKRTASSNEEGYYTIGLLEEGSYRIAVQLQGFKPIERSGVRLSAHQIAKLDFILEVGELTQTVDVQADVSALNFENAELKQAINPMALAELPLLVSGNQRSAASFALLIPGVTTGGGANTFDARINGGLQSGDEALLDGVSMQQGLMSQGGMVSIFADYPISPESISEVNVLTSNYEAQYGSTTSAIITAVTKSGTKDFHGSLYEYHRNTALNARQFGAPKPKNIENEFGATIGGPVKIPKLGWTDRRKTYFFFAFDRWYARGGTVAPVLSIPSLKERQGDFTDWIDGSGNLIPVYDPATTRPNPAYDAGRPVGPANLPFLRDQFMGCDGRTPNVICASDSRLQNSLAKKWFQFLPQPTFSGAINNFVSTPVPQISGVPVNYKQSIDIRVDHHISDKDHVAVIIHHHQPISTKVSALPRQLATERFITDGAAVGPWTNRVNWDHNFSPTLLNNVNFGYLNFRGRESCVDTEFATVLPQIPGVARHNSPPVLGFQDFSQFGCNGLNFTQRPAYIVNDLATWVRGKHTFKFGGEYRKLTLDSENEGNSSGAFTFSRLNTGLLGLNSGNAIASFLLEQVSSANTQFRTVSKFYARSDQWNLNVSDTWKVTPTLSLNYGLRWDVARPSVESSDNFSFFDPVGPNPGAGNRPGRLAFAGTRHGAASFGSRHPEKTWYKGFAPRLGIAYSVTPRTVVRTGYGIFYTQAFYPGWAGGMSLDGFNLNPAFSSSDGGLTAAFLLSQGFPQNFPKPPFINSAFLNGQAGPLYRPFDANRLTYSQQWNLTIEHEFTEKFYVSVGYVGNKGTRLPSLAVPLNALDPRLLSQGQKLFDQFRPGQTELHGVTIPYAGWVEQMRACPPSVAQALLPFPQYCGPLRGINENAGSSTYHSFQFKAEKRLSEGTWLLGSYTLSKLLTTSDHVQEPVGAGVRTGAHGIISPFERHRNKALATDDVPQVFALSFIYDLPFGSGKRFLDRRGPVNKILGGWQISSIYRASAGTPFFFRSGNCTVPAQFRVGCIPAILPGANPFAQDKGNFDPSRPLFNRGAFEPTNSFNFYYGQGPRVTDLRNFGFHKHDISLVKNAKISESVGIQFRAEFFNAWNWHTFTARASWREPSAFVTDVSSPRFGMWNGTVSEPRNIQFGLRFLF